jgi:hypothetical protein
MTLQTRTRRLLRALALSAAMMALMPAQGRADAFSITRFFDPSTPVADYSFNRGSFSYTFRLGFDVVFRPFGVTMTDNLVSGVETDGDFSDGNFGCVEMGNPDGPSCVTFTASAPTYFYSLPSPGQDFGGNINIGIAYNIYGFPGVGDPVDIGEVVEFSGFTVLFDKEQGFRLAHAPSSGGGVFTDNATFQGSNGHCGGFDDIIGSQSSALDACAESKGFSFGTPVPEPSSILLLSFGIGSLALGQLRRRRRGQ